MKKMMMSCLDEKCENIKSEYDEDTLNMLDDIKWMYLTVKDMPIVSKLIYNCERKQQSKYVKNIVGDRKPTLKDMHQVYNCMFENTMIFNKNPTWIGYIFNGEAKNNVKY